MSKLECFLLCVIFLLLSGLTVIVSIDCQYRKNEELKYEALMTKISKLHEEDKRQESVINAIIRTEAMQGKFDKGGAK